MYNRPFFFSRRLMWKAFIFQAI